jgi:hypothetical protein
VEVEDILVVEAAVEAAEEDTPVEAAVHRMLPQVVVVAHLMLQRVAVAELQRTLQVVEAAVQRMLPAVAVALLLLLIRHFTRRLPGRQPFIRRPPVDKLRWSIVRPHSVIRALRPGLPAPARRTPRIPQPAFMPRQAFIRRPASREMQEGRRESEPLSIPAVRELMRRLPATGQDSDRDRSGLPARAGRASTVR